MSGRTRDLMFHSRSRTWPKAARIQDAAREPRAARGQAGHRGAHVPAVPAGPGRAGGAGPDADELPAGDHSCPAFSDRPCGPAARRVPVPRRAGPLDRPGAPARRPGARGVPAAVLQRRPACTSSRSTSGSTAAPTWPAASTTTTRSGTRSPSSTMTRPVLDGLLDMAMVAAGSHRRPSALLTMTARMSRLAWARSAGRRTRRRCSTSGALQQVFSLPRRRWGWPRTRFPWTPATASTGR